MPLESAPRSDDAAAGSPQVLVLHRRRWASGILGSWLLVWLIGPYVLNSILVRVYDPQLEVNTLRPGDLVRWRSEGWGNTLTGPHGLPGWQPAATDQRVVIWGDSQVEGHCVDDPDKIHSLAIKRISDDSPRKLDVLPMGRSGSDARDWQDLKPQADQLWQPLLHIWIVTDLSDLVWIVPDEAEDEYRRWTVESPRWVRLAAKLRAEALMAAAKRHLRDPRDDGPRRFRWTVGPVNPADAESGTDPTAQAALARRAERVAEAVEACARRHDGRLAIIYAPTVPTFAGGLVTSHPDDEFFEHIAEALQARGIETVDLRSPFIDLWHRETKLPRGFHNGMPGFGHLNPDGNRIVAAAVADLAIRRSASPDRDETEDDPAGR